MALSVPWSLTIPAVRAPMTVLPRTVLPPEWSSRKPIPALSARFSRKVLLQPNAAVNAARSADEASLR